MHDQHFLFAKQIQCEGFIVLEREDFRGQFREQVQGGLGFTQLTPGIDSAPRPDPVGDRVCRWAAPV